MIKKLLTKIVFFPALVFWVPFVICWKLANKLIPEEGKYSHWFWLEVEAINHETFYDDYEI